MTHRSIGAAGALLAIAILLLAGCSKSPSSALISNQRPQIQLSGGPLPGSTEQYAAKFNWFAWDADGQVVRYIYAVDPPISGDTTWIETRASEVTRFFRSPDPGPPPYDPLVSNIVALGYHTFVIKAIDNEGAQSPPVDRSFTAKTIAPTTAINTPRPNDQQPVSITPSVTISWTGFDTDGVITQKPVKYKFRIVPASDINPSNPNGVTKAQLQAYFGADAPNFFAQWDSVSGDTTSKFYEGLTPNSTYYFAIVAFDEAGAFEPRFRLTSNVLAIRPNLNKLGPAITVFNEFFSRKQSTGGISLAESRIVKLEFPADSRVTFNWTADPPTGALISGYRWAVDLSDIDDETARRDDADVNHWSAWSVNETSATIGPFAGSLDSTVTHFFFLEARDNLGFVSLYTIRLNIIEPRFDRELLVIDDMYGTLTGSNYTGGYPMEAEADTFFYAVGGQPDSLRIKFENNPSLVTEPGMFADFDYDTLDYQFYPNEGILLSDLTRYKVVAWYTDLASSSRNSTKFGRSPSTAIRLINSKDRLNTLAVYLRQFGKAWLFGDGTTQAIANGFQSKIGGGTTAPVPYSFNEDGTGQLRLGNFLYDFIHMRSEVNTAGTIQSSLTLQQRLQECIPYLPEFQCASTPPTHNRDCDPRIGPSAARTAVKWSGLPLLTLRSYRGAIADVSLRAIYPSMVISKPLFITEGAGATFHSVLDTLYVCGARDYDPNRTRTPPSDGFPNGLYYHGSEHGEVVWFGFPMYFFEHDQARQATRVVLDNLGVPRAAPGASRGAHPFISSSPAVRVVDGGETEDTFAIRRAGR